MTCVIRINQDLMEITKVLKKIYFIVFSFFGLKTNQRKLGYRNSSKLLIIHADDFGLTPSENKATIEALNKGLVCSASIMVNCRGFDEAASYARSHQDSDLGVHLTLTSEWDSYKWGPVLPPSEVKSLVDENGHFFKTKAKMGSESRPEQVENELRTQIEVALKSGVDLTHLDSHMFVTTANHEILEICVRLSKEYRIPLLLTKDLPFHYLLRRDLFFVDQLIYARPENLGDLHGFYKQALRSIKPGLNCLIIHTAFNDKEIQDLTSNREVYGPEWRQADFDFFTSEECRNILSENDIRLVTWREVRDKFVRLG
jgi:chitin disaccharide deacetylase